MLDVLRATQRIADLVALRAQEGEAHRTADQDRVGDLQETIDHADLVGHLRPADDRHEGAVGLLEDLLQRAHLGFEQPPGGARQHVRDALGRGLRPVGGAEGVVDVEVRELGKAAGEGRVVGFLAGLETDVLEQQDVPVGEPLARAPRLLAADAGRELHARAGQLRQPAGDRRHREARVRLALGAPEV